MRGAEPCKDRASVPGHYDHVVQGGGGVQKPRTIGTVEASEEREKAEELPQCNGNEAGKRGIRNVRAPEVKAEQDQEGEGVAGGERAMGTTSQMHCTTVNDETEAQTLCCAGGACPRGRFALGLVEGGLRSAMRSAWPAPLWQACRGLGLAVCPGWPPKVRCGPATWLQRNQPSHGRHRILPRVIDPPPPPPRAAHCISSVRAPLARGPCAAAGAQGGGGGSKQGTGQQFWGSPLRPRTCAGRALWGGALLLRVEEAQGAFRWILGT